MSNYEPPAEMVEALAKELHAAYRVALPVCSELTLDDACYSTQDGRKEQARFVLRRQYERERGLLEALNYYALCRNGLDLVACNALAAHAKLDAPKAPEAPTLLEAAKALRPGASDNKYLCIPNHLYEALKAAVEREEKREKR